MTGEAEPQNLLIVTVRTLDKTQVRCMSAYVGECVAQVYNAAARSMVVDTGEELTAALPQQEWDPRFQAARYGCSACKGLVELDQGGKVSATDCLVTGSCERSWADMHPELYQKADGTPIVDRMPCAGLDCHATLVLSDPGDPARFAPLLEGECANDVEGRRWHEVGRHWLDELKPVRPEDGFERYDGERFAGDGI